MAESVLTISNIGFPPLSLRGCKQELILQADGEIKKTINGKLVFIKHSDTQKYKTKITCSDVNCPALGNLGIGNVVEIECIQNIWQMYKPDEELSRQPVPDSVIVTDENGRHLKYKLNGLKLEVIGAGTGEIFIAFRPRLTMVITDFKTEIDEWNLKGNWTITANEI